MIGSKAARRRIRHAGVYLVLIALSTVFMMPLIWLIRSSFMSIIQIFRMPPEWIPRPFLLENYKTALTVLPFGRYALNTMLLVVNGVAGVVITSSFCAYSFARLHWKGRRFFFGLIMSGIMLPYAVTLIPTFLGWRYLVGSDSFLPLMIPAWFGGGAFNIFLLRQFMLGIPRELEDAAVIDSARYDQIFMRIIIPLTKPALIVVGLFCFFTIWNDYLGPLIYLNDDSRFTLALGLTQFIGFYSAQWHLLMAASAVVVIPPILLFFIGQRFLVQGITLTGLKG